MTHFVLLFDDFILNYFSAFKNNILFFFLFFNIKMYNNSLESSTFSPYNGIKISISKNFS